LTLKTDYASSIYSGEYLKTIVLGAPTGGFLSGLAVLGGGTTSIVAAVIVLLLIIVVFFIVRKAVRKK
jgi:predicted MFS family arabinose efflux permease